MPITTIGPFSYQEFLTRVETFHGYSAPGVVLGGVMVDQIIKKLPTGILFDAISETDRCLPDAVQLLTPCTVGNGWLRVYDWGRFAVALYDKETGLGLRAVLHFDRLADWPEINDWYFKLKPKAETDPQVLVRTIREGGSDLCRLEAVQLKPDWLMKRSRGKRILCGRCREPFPDNGLGICLPCQGDSPYRSKILE